MEPVDCAEIASGSPKIWTKAQHAAGFRSRYQTGEWDRLYDAWELAAWRKMKQEEERAREMKEVLDRVVI